MFTVLLPSGTPLPARRHHVLSGGGKLSSLCLEIYQRGATEQPEKLATVRPDLRPHAATRDRFIFLILQSLAV